MPKRQFYDRPGEDASTFPVDEFGRPATYLAYKVLKTLFSRPQRWYSSADLAQQLTADEPDILPLLRRLDLLDFVEHATVSPRTYKYNLHSNNFALQAKLEEFLLDVEQNGLPSFILYDRRVPA